MNRIAALVVILAACGGVQPVTSQPAPGVPPSQATTPLAAPVSPPPTEPPTAPKPAPTPTVFADPAAATHRVTVKAKLIAIRGEMPHCGGIHFGTVVEYEVIAVEAGSIDSLRVLAAVGCIQLPRRSYDTNAGTLERFEIGGVHRLTLGTDRADSRGMSVMATPSLFYVISADPA